MTTAFVITNILPAKTRSPEETIALGERLASRLSPGAIVALHGDLGAGKTHLVRGIGRGLGVPEAEVSSPTFTLLHEYQGGRLPVYHFDAYRIRTIEEFYDLGYEDYFFGDGVCLVEWPERVAPLLPPETLHLRLEHAGEDVRRVEVVR